MRKSLKQVRHTSALIVNNKEANIIRAVVDRQRKHIGLKSLTFTGTCSTGYQTVRSMVFFMNIHVTGGTTGFLTDKSTDIVIISVFQPAFLRFQI